MPRRSSNAPRKSSALYLDGGWAWMVMVASFLSNTLIGSVYFGYGILLPEWLSEFQSSSAITSFVGSTTAGVISGSGPLASFVILKWGCRTSHMLGGVIIAVALICCCFAASMLQIFILYSVIAGVGGGLCYVPSVITISEYFKTKRSIAIGIVCSGIGCGSFVFPVFYEYLIGQYGWRGVMLISGAINLNMVAFGLVMCPVGKAPDLDFTICIPNRRSNSSSEDSEVQTLTSDINSNILNKGHTVCDDGIRGNRRRSSFQLMRAWLRNTLTCRKLSLAKYKTDVVIRVGSQEAEGLRIEKTIYEEEEDIETLGPLKLDAPMTGQHETYIDQLVSLLKMPSFYVLLFHNITMFFGMMIVFGLTPLRAVTDHDMTTAQGALLVSIMGGSNLFGRFAWGFIASFKVVNTSLLFVCLRLTAGALTLASPFATSFALSATYCALVGMALGNWALYPIVVGERFGDRLLNVAFGYLEAANGIGCMIGPLVGGLLYDITDTYLYSFIAGGSALLAGVVPLIVTFLLKRTVKRKKVNVNALEIGNK